MEETSEAAGHYPDRWTLIRDVVVLQAKLVVDGFRDLLLVPASIIAALVSLVSSDDGWSRAKETMGATTNTSSSPRSATRSTPTPCWKARACTSP